MSHSEITFTTKVEDGGTTAAGLVSAADLNEIKSVVNGNGSNVDGRLDVVEGYVTTQESYAEISADGPISARVTAVNLPTGSVTVSLPSAATVAKQFFTVKRVANGVNVLTITSAELIDSVSNDIVLGIIHESITFYSDGVNYIITERNTAAYSSVSTTASTNFAATTTAQKLTTWDTNVISTAGRMNADQANNRVDVIYASGDAFDRIKIASEISLQFASNVTATFYAYYAGSPVGQPFSISGLGVGKSTTIPIQAIHSATGVGSVEIWVSTTSAETLTVLSGSLYVESLSD
jgi:hypothetical protein